VNLLLVRVCREYSDNDILTALLTKCTYCHPVMVPSLNPGAGNVE
jgi:hypothetical protein